MRNLKVGQEVNLGENLAKMMWNNKGHRNNHKKKPSLKLTVQPLSRREIRDQDTVRKETRLIRNDRNPKDKVLLATSHLVNQIANMFKVGLRFMAERQGLPKKCRSREVDHGSTRPRREILG
jgi:hypothetical protein